MSKTQSFSIATLELILNNDIVAPMTNLAAAGSAGALHLALFTTAPTNTANGTEVTTGQYQNYSRQSVDRDDTNKEWTVSTDSGRGRAVNVNDIVFPAAGGSSSGASINAIGVMTSASGGNLLYFGTISPPMTIGVNSQPRFNAGQFIIRED